LAVAVAPLAAGRPFAVSPGVPADRVKILQEAFRKALEDPELFAEAAKGDRPIDFMPPDELAALYAEILAAPDDVIAKFSETPSVKVAVALDDVQDDGKVIVFQGTGSKVNSAISNSRTKIVIAGKEAKRKALKAGMNCTVEYNPGNAENEASLVDCK
jgi:hypothetical protein